jgi:dolichyl-phosphate-mannose-protein mannosyltransferase
MIQSVPVATLPGIRRQAAVLLVVGALTHFVGLTSPRQVVFDEVTFGQYVQAYCCTGERFFDIHPPHGKLLVALAARIGGFDRSFVFERIGQPYGAAPVAALRVVPALAGTLIPLLFFLLLRELKASPRIALIGGLLVALDNGFLAETRLLLIDGILIAATLGALVCFLAAQRSGRLWVLVSSGLLAGLAVGTKLTGLAAPGLILLCLAFGLGVVRATPGDRVRQALVVVAAAAAMYAAGWIVHWMILPNPGPGDAFYATTGHVVTDLISAQRTMLSANVGLTATHPDGSAPWTWPLMKVAPYFWQGDGAAIYMIGNPVVWWGTSLLFLALLVQIAVMRPLGVPLVPAVNPAPRIWMPLAGFFLAFLPFFRITRVLFLYHYLTPLLFSLAFVLLWLDRAGWAGPSGPTPRSYRVIIGLAAAGFLIMSPLTYGFSVGGYDEWLAGIVRSWR